MNNKEILSEYAKIGINSPDELYDYAINNDEVTINNSKFNLSCSNEVIEFMAIFLSASKYKLIRLYFEKELENGENFRHWFLILNNGDRWYYFEPVLEQFRGQFGFDSYNEILFFIVDKLNQLYNTENKHYILKEISSLNTRDLDNNIKQSLGGTDIFVSASLVPKKKKFDKDVIFNYIKKAFSNFPNYDIFFIFAAILVVGIVIMLIWLAFQPGGII